MRRSHATADPTADQSLTRGPKCSGYPSCKHTPNGPRNGAALNNGGAPANSPMSELAQLMEEPPHGPNNGRRAADNPEAEGRHLPLGAESAQVMEFIREGGWTFVTTGPGVRGVGGEWKRSGGTTHRGVLHADEYVDHEALRPMVEDELGFSYEQVRSVYRQGRLTAHQRELRGQIDARVLALSRSGGNVALLGRVLGFHVNESGACEALNNALARARKEERS